MILRLTSEMKSDSELMKRLFEAGCLPALEPWEHVEDMVCVSYQCAQSFAMRAFLMLRNSVLWRPDKIPIIK